MNLDESIDYLRSVWDRFVNLSPRIIDLQHRAAELGYRARQLGDVASADRAKEIIRSLGTLNQQHGRAIEMMSSIGEFIGIGGLSGYYTGLGAWPVAVVAGVPIVLGIVVWAFRAMEVEEKNIDTINRGLDLIESGAATPEQVGEILGKDLLDPGSAPSMGPFAGLAQLLESLGGVGKVAVAGLALYVALQLVPMFAGGRRAARRNPPLVVFERNPPADVIGRRVLAVWYEHERDGRPYVHKFGDDVELLAEPDGSVRLEHTGGSDLWADFDVDEEEDLEALEEEDVDDDDIEALDEFDEEEDDDEDDEGGMW